MQRAFGGQGLPCRNQAARTEAASGPIARRTLPITSVHENGGGSAIWNASQMRVGEAGGTSVVGLGPGGEDEVAAQPARSTASATSRADLTAP